ncbi:MAG: bifunctional alpha,alpha-trehalose-phosphate synthase (UDP-forming)/trehalose-phosphatase [Bacteroidales bacterium]|nr:bifunctional alpha,alpha-trehalose-phosphate synthase (UDP-forming)/trehalose-phosphatase [Bacteroidales bacterium]MDT8373159.1 bifunctional alpha,alpha-trehalose-phosphate synthase (UDP-forming)/trehalose-phosphatase [Bacteroidales bacterium]
MSKSKPSDFTRIVIVAYRLPFTLKHRNGKLTAVQNTGGLVSAVLSLTQRMKSESENETMEKTVWVGKGEYDNERLNSLPEVKETFELSSVRIPDSVNEKFYGGFCNDLIWPLFHYFPSMAVFGQGYFESYKKANELFYKELRKIIRPGDFVWIHDYQLFLLPAMVREEFPEASVAFFLHIPFPSYEVFRIMPDGYQKAILQGLLGADLIGFHTHDYAQHFLKSVRRCLGYDISLNTVTAEDVYSRADAFPISIDYNKFHDSVLLPETEKYISRIRKQKRDRLLIFSVDRLDYTKGFLNRLSAFELFLERYPGMRGRVIFNMVMVPSRDTIVRYQEMKKEIEATVGRINGKYGTLDWNPIIYQYRSLKFNELVALYSHSDVGLLTPLRDGMNLVAKEYVAAQHKRAGMLILSELAGAAAEMGESVLVNPSDIGQMADAIHEALTMKDDEKHKRLEAMKNRIREYDVFSWADDILRTTVKVKADRESYRIRLINKDIEDRIITSFCKAASPVLFLDYDGTLVPIRELPELAVPETTLVDLTARLASVTELVIISGRNRDFLDRWFSEVNVTLVAEHGAFIRYAGGEWESSLGQDATWKEGIMPVMSRFTNRCKGSFVEEKRASLSWHYRNADEDLSALRAIELKSELEEMILNMPLQIIDGHKVVEVKMAGYNKGTAAMKVTASGRNDFVLAIGDDKTDEELFAALPDSAVTIKVGKGPTNATYNFTKQTSVTRFLERMIEAREKQECS